MALCYTPTFPYQCHFDGYVEMSEEDAALFWEIGDHPTLDPESISVGPMLSDRAAPMTGEAASETTISTRPMPSGMSDDDRSTNNGPDNPRCPKGCANPADDR